MPDILCNFALGYTYLYIRHEAYRSGGCHYLPGRPDLRHAARLWRVERLVGVSRRREIREELNTEISVDRFVMTVEHDYPAFHLTMHCYVCHVLSGHLELLEAEDARWLREDNLSGVRWLPADRQVVDNLRATHLLDK